MTKMPTVRLPRRVPFRASVREISPETKARLEAEREARYQQARAIFERVRPEVIADRYNWYITIEPNSEDYFIDKDHMIALQKLREKHPQGKVVTFRLNETGTCGTI